MAVSDPTEIGDLQTTLSATQRVPVGDGARPRPPLDWTTLGYKNQTLRGITRRTEMLTYHPLEASSAQEWLELLNADRVRKHLVAHPRFTPRTLDAWLRTKTEQDQQPGCRVRGIRNGGTLVGRCGIQHEAGGYELALVLSPDSWGLGREVLVGLKAWARELGHQQLLAHLPRTRPQTRALARLFGQPTGVTEIAGCTFDPYRIDL